jgi:tRNA-guanine family transglycosylase
MIESPEANKMQRHLVTPSGTIEYPAYIPVTTFGDKYPLDALIQPYLPRLAQAVMVSFHYAQKMATKPRVPVLIDSGGFAALFEGSKVIERRGLGILEIDKGGEKEELTPLKVLDFQEQRADIAFTLDFPIPPSLDKKEAHRRQEMTVANAVWALENRRRKDMPLLACIQGLDVNGYLKIADQLSQHDFEGFAIGGLVPRIKDKALLENVVVGVRRIVKDKLLHVLGVGNPEVVEWLFGLGVDSVDSSSYVKMAADGKTWAHPGKKLADPSVSERMLLALTNLKSAARITAFGKRLDSFIAM